MKRHFNTISIRIFAVVLLVSLFSCQTDLLDPKPKITFPAEVVYDTPQRVAQLVNGLYDGVKSGNFMGGRGQIYNDIRAEEFLNRQNNGVTGLQTWNHTLVESTNEVNNFWIAGYQAINKINVFLQGTEDNASTFVAPVFPADFSTKTLLQYQAEARFLRAVSYYYLLQLYARPYLDGNGSKPGLPLRLKAETDFSNNDLPRSSVAEVYAQILDDLNFAEKNLPSTASTYKAHTNTAIAFKTRVYLAMGRYADVITEANKIVPATPPFKAATGVKHELAATFNTVFAPPQETLESIFSIPSTSLDGPGTQNQLAYYYMPSPTGNGEYTLNSTGIYGDAFWKAEDARRKLTTTVTNATTGAKTYYLTKYPTGSPYTDNAPIIRYAEVLLNLAEAKVGETNTVDEQAVALLNAVHGRSDATTTFTTADFPDAIALVATILKERRIEFLGEGLRSIDIMRLNQTIPAKGSVAAVSPADPSYVWPIPSTERSTNKAIEPN